MNWYRISTGQFGYPQPEDTYLEETYDLAAGCPTCGIGKALRNAFRFRSEPKAKHSQFLGLNWVFDEVFVRDAVKHVFEEQGVTGVAFTRPVRHSTGEPLETVYHLRVSVILPPALRPDQLDTETCEMPKDPATVKFLTANSSRLVRGPFCGAVKFNYPQENDGQITMPASAFVSAPDIVRMNEWFGSGGSAGRPVLVSQRVKDIVDRMKWRGLMFSPIEIVNE
ncbi:hypothetical protein EZI54_17440 [Marinobacter halodurans]|uniref:Uncharacterized protein n=1 Tax=Marinobacter halodurans TaxID=2528979 RepID=A0ABY1ZGV1_9GAMM|nr:hypothetical protein [Marinobacter halodurans]TBW51303.1 hypothetical protein EZI54_17440 [Marinobacter halodurans]